MYWLFWVAIDNLQALHKYMRTNEFQIYITLKHENQIEQFLRFNQNFSDIDTLFTIIWASLGTWCEIEFEGNQCAILKLYLTI